MLKCNGLFHSVLRNVLLIVGGIRQANLLADGLDLSHQARPPFFKGLARKGFFCLTKNLGLFWDKKSVFFVKGVGFFLEENGFCFAVSLWYEDHSTPNPNGVQPNPKITKIVKGNKFDPNGVTIVGWINTGSYQKVPFGWSHHRRQNNYRVIQMNFGRCEKLTDGNHSWNKRKFYAYSSIHYFS